MAWFCVKKIHNETFTKVQFILEICWGNYQDRYQIIAMRICTYYIMYIILDVFASK